MTISVAQFRADYPEFSSTTNFPSSGIQYWLNVAYELLNASRWGAQLDLGAELYVAHNIALEARAQKEALSGGIPGQQSGTVSSKSVDKVSVGYDTNAASEEGGGHWNLTIYGTRLYRLIKLMGAGPVYLGIGSSPILNGPAWPGPDTTPGFTNFS
jgi:hypothetical protein